MSKIAVMVVEDSRVATELITSTLNSDPRLTVIAAVETAEKALRLIPRMAPDVICMDVRLPGMNGIEATRRIMEEYPTPIVVVAADMSRETVNNTMEALRAGAMAVVEKPTIESASAYKAMSRLLCDQFVNMSQVRVVRQRFNGMQRRGAADRPVPTIVVPQPQAEPGIEVVGVVASTGGPAAVAQLLQGLGPRFPLPVLLVQHMGSEFLPGFTAWLDSICEQTVVLARNLEKPKPGHVYVAPGGHQLTYLAGHLRLAPEMVGVGAYVPSGDVLLESLASQAGPRAVGVVLTGMGDDGAKGLLAMRKAGAGTLVQDRTTSVVFGMPAAALELGASREELPIGAIARRVVELVNRSSKVVELS